MTDPYSSAPEAPGSRKAAVLAAEAIRACGTDDFFYLPGGPMNRIVAGLVDMGVRGVDTRDERAAAFAAIAYARTLQRPAVVISSAGPGTTNITTGAAHALADGAPVVAIGGSTPLYQRGTGGFQETDQAGLLRTVTKGSTQVTSLDGLVPGLVAGFRTALSGAPGPVYIDLPADVIYADATRCRLDSQSIEVAPERVAASDEGIATAVGLLRQAERPVIVAGSGVLWSQAWAELRVLAESAGIPVLTTPAARGILPEDHPLSLNGSRTAAFSGSDCVIVVGTRRNYVVGWLEPPVFADDKSLIQVNLDASAMLARGPRELAIPADAKLVLAALTQALAAGAVDSARYAPWLELLQAGAVSRRARMVETEGLEGTPIHPLRLCFELERVLPQNTVLTCDGHEILGFSRQSMTARLPGHVLTPGTYGTMGVGLPFAIGAKVARPDAPVVALTGDGAFGFHAMELDTAARHGLGIVVVISNNGGWGGGDHKLPGTKLDSADYHKMAPIFGGWGCRVEAPDEVAPAVEEALAFAEKTARPAVVNVITSAARVPGRPFTHYAPV